MKTATALGLFGAFALFAATAIASPQPATQEAGDSWGLVPDEDPGTLPYVRYEFTHYLVVLGAEEELHGTRVVREYMGGAASYVYEFVALDAMMVPRAPVGAQSGVPPIQLGSSWSLASEVTADTLFQGSSGFMGDYAFEGGWVPIPPAIAGACVSEDCKIPNNACSGYCDTFGTWHCICTPFGGGSSSGAIAKKHKNRLEAWQKEFPPAEDE